MDAVLLQAKATSKTGGQQELPAALQNQSHRSKAGQAGRPMARSQVAHAGKGTSRPSKQASQSLVPTAQGGSATASHTSRGAAATLQATSSKQSAAGQKKGDQAPKACGEVNDKSKDLSGGFQPVVRRRNRKALNPNTWNQG